MFCRFCGTTKTSRWRQSPWGKNKLCNAHWRKWQTGKLDLSMYVDCPEQAICPRQNNERTFVSRQKRKRSNSFTVHPEDMTQSMEALSNIRKHLEQTHNMTQTLREYNFTASSLALESKQNSVDLLFTQYRNLCQRVQTECKHQDNWGAIELYMGQRNICMDAFLATSSTFIRWLRMESKRFQGNIHFITCVLQMYQLVPSFPSAFRESPTQKGEGSKKRMKTNRSLYHSILQIEKEAQYLMNVFESTKEKNTMDIQLALEKAEGVLKEFKDVRKKHMRRRQRYKIRKKHWEEECVELRFLECQGKKLLFPEHDYIKMYYQQRMERFQVPIQYRNISEFDILSESPLEKFEVLDGNKMYTLLKFTYPSDTSIQYYREYSQVSTVRNVEYIFANGPDVYLCVTHQHLNHVGRVTCPERFKLLALQLLKHLKTVPYSVKYNQLKCYGTYQHKLLLDLPQKPTLEPDETARCKEYGILLYKMFTDGKVPGVEPISKRIADIHLSAMITTCFEDSIGFDDLEQMSYWMEPVLSEMKSNNTIPNNEELMDLVHHHIQSVQRVNFEAEPLLVNRKDIVESLFNCFATLHLTDENIHFKYEIRYYAERGEGNGVTRDVFSQFFTELAKHRILEEKEGLFLPRCPSSELCEACGNKKCQFISMRHYNLLGQICAKLILDEIPIPLRFHGAFTRFIMNKSANMNDMKHYDVETYNMLHRFKQVPSVEPFEITWGNIRPHAPHTLVTDDTLDDYIHERIQHELFEKRMGALDSIRGGMLSFKLIRSLTKIITVNNFHFLCFGDPCVEYETLLALCTYNNPLNETHPSRVAFETWCRETTPEQRVKLLIWCTGYASIPLSGVNFSIQVSLVPGPHGAYPQTRSCFKRLSIPSYRSFNKEDNLADFTEKMNFVLSEQGRVFSRR